MRAFVIILLAPGAILQYLGFVPKSANVHFHAHQREPVDPLVSISDTYTSFLIFASCEDW